MPDATNKPITVYSQSNCRGQRVLLSEKIDSGGQGIVYTKTLPSGVNAAFKIFHPRLITPALQDKLRHMMDIGQKNDNELIRKKEIAWPQQIVYDKAGEFIGYAMKRAKGKKLSLLAHPINAMQHFPGIDRKKVAGMLIRLWQAADTLHQHRIFIGDVNLDNVLCNPANFRPCLIDADSYQVAQWRCPVGCHNMTAPEHLGYQNYAEATRTRESDIFSLAILSFQCLMLGQHPYSHIGGGTLKENQRKGHMPYLKGNNARPGMAGGVPLGPWLIYWDNYPSIIKKLFERTLCTGREIPASRPSTKEWIDGLYDLIECLQRPQAKTPDGRLFQHRREMKPTAPMPKGLTPLPRIPRIICSLVLDTSINMGSEAVEKMNGGIRNFMQSIRQGDLVRFPIEVEIFTCGGRVSHHSQRQGSPWRNLAAHGDAFIGGGLNDALEQIKLRQAEFKQRGISSYRPWLILITAGKSADDCEAVGAQLTRMRVNNHIEPFAFIVGKQYNVTSMAGIDPDRCRPLDELKFAEFFDWLKQCMSAVSLSVPGYDWKTPRIDSWAPNNYSSSR